MIGVAFTIFISAAGKVVADEFRAWAPRLTEWLIARSVTRLPKDQRGRYGEEWRSDVNNIPGEVSKIFWAVRYMLAARKILPETATSLDELPPSAVHSSWRRALLRLQSGRTADDLAQPIFEKMGHMQWVGQDDIDPPVPGRTAESARDQGALYVVLNMLAESRLISYRSGYAQVRPGFPATKYFWFRLTWWGKFFRRWPAFLRRAFLLAVWLVRWQPLRRSARTAAILVAVILAAYEL
jgi:hypothetical protein